MRRALLAALAASLAITAAISLRSSSYAADPLPAARAAQAPRVRVAPATPAPATQPHTFTARVSAASGSALAFTLPGRVLSRAASTGDAVKRGQLLATLDPAPLRNARSAADAQLRSLTAQRDQLARDVRRADALARANAGSAEELERLQSALVGLDASIDAARVQQREASRQLAESSLRAPFDGVITAAILDVGDVAAAGAPAFMIGQSEQQLELELLIPESLISSVSPGLAASISAPLARLLPVTAPIITVSQHAAQRSGLFSARIEIPSAGGWRPGMTAEVKLDLPSAPGWLVPLSAVVSPDAAQPAVVCVRGGLAQPVPVQLVAILDGGAVVTGDLSSSDQVITAGHFAIQRGAKVEVAP